MKNLSYVFFAYALFLTNLYADSIAPVEELTIASDTSKLRIIDLPDTSNRGIYGTSSTTILKISSDETICEGGSVMISGGFVVTGLEPPYSYSWSPPTGLSCTDCSTPDASPLTTTPYSVTITDSEGTELTSTVTVNVNPIPVANAGPDITICKGAAAPLSASGGGPSATYSWSPAGGLSDPNIFNPIANPMSTRLYTVTVDDGGCVDSDNITVNVNPLPNPSVSGDETICEGENTTLSASGGETYSWSHAGSLDDHEIPDPVASPLATTTYTVTVTSLEGCESTDNITITVDPLPTAMASADVTICEGENTTLSASGGGTYSWSNAGSLDDHEIPDPEASPLVTTTYTVTVTSPDGCENTDNTTVTVNPLPSPMIDPILPICEGGSVVLSASGGDTYSWLPTAELTDPAIADPIATPSSTTGYTVTVSNGCGSANETVTVTVNTGPSPLVSAVPPFCAGGSVMLSASGGDTYSWLPIDDLDDPTSATPEASPPVPRDYTVTVGNDCGMAMATVTVTVHPLPNPTISPDTAICEGDTVTLSSTGGASSTYTWFPVDDLSDPNIFNPVADPMDSTIYTVTVTTVNGCVDSASITLGIYPLPSPMVLPDTAICSGQTISLLASGDSTSTYSWFPVDDLSDPNTSNPLANPHDTTTYTVTVTTEQGCVDSNSTTVIVNPLPVPSVSDNDTICVGETDTLTATGGTWYVWSPGESLSDSLIPSPLASPLSTTTYSVIIIGTNSCVDSINTTVVVNPLPDPMASADTVICNNETVSLNATGGDLYNWTPETYLSDTTSASPLASPLGPGIFKYYIEVTDTNGCMGTDSTQIRVSELGPFLPSAHPNPTCAFDTTQLDVHFLDCSTYIWNTIPFTPILTPDTGTVTTAPLGDDQLSDPLNIGFSFEFYCIPYTEFFISSNGFITFSSGSMSGCCTGGTLPDASLPNNSIYVAWEDFNPGSGGTIDYFILGDAPFRKLIINFDGVPHASGGFPMTSQIILYETTNIIEIHTLEMSSNGGNHTMGIENNDGTNALVIPDRNGQDWSAFYEGIQFSPYSVDSLPFAYSWASPMGFSSTNASPVTTVASNTTFILTVNDSSCEITDSVTVGVLFPPASADAGADTSICVGDTIMLNASGGNTYNWTSTDSLFPPSIPNPAVSPMTTTTYSVTVENACATTSDDVTITVHPLPAITINPDIMICRGGSASLNSSIFGDGLYSWSPVAGLSDPDTSDPVTTPFNTTTYTVNVTDVNGCVNSASTTVLINELADIVPTTDPNPICSDTSVQLDVLIYTCNNYVFDTIPFAPISGTGTPVILSDDEVSTALAIGFDFEFYCNTYDTFYISSNGFITFSASSSNGCCSGGILPSSDSPNDLVAFAWGDLDSSAGGSIQYFTTGIAPNQKLVVNFRDVPHSGPGGEVTSQIVLYEGTNIIEIHTTAMPGASEDHTMGVENSDGTLATPAPGRNSTPWSAYNEGGQFRPYAEGGTGETYTWTPDIGLNDPTIANPIASGFDATTYTVTVDNDTCTVTESITLTAFSNELVISEDDTLCIGESITLSVSSTPGAVSYVWTPGAGLSDSSSAAPISSPTVTTTYTVHTTDSNGCENNAEVTLTVDTIPEADFTFSLPGPTVDFTDMSIGATTYEWLFGDGSGDNVPSPNHTYTDNGIYPVTLIVTNSCGSDTLAQDVDVTGVGVESNEIAGRVRVFPNPAKNLIYVEWIGRRTTPTSISLHNVVGEQLIEITDWPLDQAIIEIDMTALTAGMYFVNVYARSGTLTKKIIKLRP